MEHQWNHLRTLFAGQKQNLCRKISVFILLLASMYYLAGVYIAPPQPVGESYHYMLSTITLMERFSISFKRGDLKTAEKLFPEHESSWNGKRQLPVYQKNDSNFLVRLATAPAFDPNYLGRSFYWGTYSFLCIPACVLLPLAGISASYSFPLTNALLLIFPLLALFFFLKLNETYKMLLIFLQAVSPALVYLVWPSAEICLFAFVSLGLIFLWNRQYKLAALAVSLAGSLNVTVMPLGLLILLYYFMDTLPGTGLRNLWKNRSFLRNTALLACCFLPMIFPLFWTWLQFHHFITMQNMSSTHELFPRFAAYLFDLDFGFLPYYNLILPLYFLLLVMTGIQRNWRHFLFGFSFLCTVFLFSFMIHINCGITAISRYLVWSAPIAVFFVVTAVAELKNSFWRRTFFCLLLGSGVLTILYLLELGGFYALPQNYLDFRDRVKSILKHYPALYNPLYSTFLAKTLHKEEGCYHYTRPAVYYDDHFYARKILLTPDTVPTLCDYYFFTGNPEDEHIFLKKIQDVANSAPGFHYINLPEPIRIRTFITLYPREINAVLEPKQNIFLYVYLLQGSWLLEISSDHFTPEISCDFPVEHPFITIEFLGRTETKLIYRLHVSGEQDTLHISLTNNGNSAVTLSNMNLKKELSAEEAVLQNKFREQIRHLSEHRSNGARQE